VLFFIGDRLFGNITVYVAGDDAAAFRFTSSLPAQLLKGLAPAIQPLLDGRGVRTAEAEAVDDDASSPRPVQPAHLLTDRAGAPAQAISLGAFLRRL
jgi:hypothetical protein